MTRMGADGYEDDPYTRVRAKIPEGLKEDFREACEEAGESMTDVLEDAIRQYVDAHDDATPDLPDDDQLRDALRALRQRAHPDSGRIDVDSAERAVAESCKVPRSAVQRRVLDPLRDRGYIGVKWGILFVRDPEEVADGGA